MSANKKSKAVTFGSKYVFWKEEQELSDEEISEEDMNDGIIASAARCAEKEMASAPAAHRSPAPLAALASGSRARSAAPRRKKATARRRVQKTDTNVVTVSLGTLAEGASIATGDPIVCSCGVYLSNTSALIGEDTKSWTCEFCGAVTENLDLADEEIPNADTLDYIVEAAPVTSSNSAHSIIFCVDISGSMCVTSEMDGKIALKGDDRRRKEADDLRQFGDGSDQFLHHSQRNKTYISRLQCVQAAIDAQLTALKKDHPNVAVGLVTFNQEVHMHGDGSGTKEVVAGDKLSDYDQMLKIGENHALTRTIGDSCAELTATVQGLEEGGATALGPALVASIAMASARPGSKVVLCTDGLANVGLGALEDKTEDEEDVADAFYDQVGTLAKTRGVGVSVVSIEGTDCRMENLGNVADQSGGDVDIVNPLQLTENFGSILAKPVIATGVNVSFVLHRGLQFRHSDDDDTPTRARAFPAAEVAAPQGAAVPPGFAAPGASRPNRMQREVGNVDEDTDLTFEYVVGKDSTKAFADLKSLPFQLQIHYTKLDGMKCVRVVSASKEMTTDRAVAEANLNVGVVGLNNIQRQAKYAQAGDYTDARSSAFSCQRMLARNARRDEETAGQYMAYLNQTEEVDTVVRQQQHVEWDAGLDLSDDDDFEAEETVRVMKKAQKKKARSKTRNDQSAKAMYTSKACSMNLFKK